MSTERIERQLCEVRMPYEATGTLREHVEKQTAFLKEISLVLSILFWLALIVIGLLIWIALKIPSTAENSYSNVKIDAQNNSGPVVEKYLSNGKLDYYETYGLKRPKPN